MGESLTGPAIAFIVSMTTLLLGGLSLRQKANASHVGSLGHRIDDLVTQVKSLTEQQKECDRQVRELRAANLDLMQRIIKEGL